MRILWASVAPFLGSGYGVQTAMTTARLQAEGHDVAIAAAMGLESSSLQWPGPRGAIPVFPKGQDPRRHNMDLVNRHAQQFQSDVIFTHYDAWCLNQKRLADGAFTLPWVPWFPIDTDEVCRSVLNAVRGLRGAAYRITQTRHGQRSMHSHGEQCAYVPASYDERVYYPRDRALAREILELEQDRFVAVMVAANHGTKDAPSRKAFPQVFQAWRWFTEQVDPDALLYIHALPKGHLDLDALAEENRIYNNFLVDDPYFLYSGTYTAEHMALIYSAADVLVSPSMGEGFGVPIVEAQACGTPAIAGDWTAMSEVTKTGWLVSKDDAARYPMAGYGGDQFIPKSEAILDCLTQAAGWQRDAASTAAGVAEYEAEHVWNEHWRPTLRDIEDHLDLGSAERDETSRQIREMILG